MEMQVDIDMDKDDVTDEGDARVVHRYEMTGVTRAAIDANECGVSDDGTCDIIMTPSPLPDPTSEIPLKIPDEDATDDAIEYKQRLIVRYEQQARQREAVMLSGRFSRDELRSIAVRLRNKRAHDTTLSVIIAPADAEAVCGNMSKSGECDVVLSTDSDSLAYGATIQVCFFGRKGQSIVHGGRMLRPGNDSECRGLGLTLPEFSTMCVLCGCDNAPRLNKVGPARAYSLVKVYGTDIERCLVALAKSEGPRQRNDEVVGDVVPRSEFIVSDAPSITASAGDATQGTGTGTGTGVDPSIVCPKPCVGCGHDCTSVCEGCGVSCCTFTCRRICGHERACFNTRVLPHLIHAQRVFNHELPLTVEVIHSSSTLDNDGSIGDDCAYSGCVDGYGGVYGEDHVEYDGWSVEASDTD